MTKIDNTAFEQWKYENQANLTIWAEQFKTTISAGEAALRSAILINGGASVALLAFVGSIWGKTTKDVEINKLLISMAIFVFGTFCGGVATSFHYLEHNSEKKTKCRNFWGKCCDICVVIAYIGFVTASMFALKAFWIRFTGNSCCN